MDSPPTRIPPGGHCELSSRSLVTRANKRGLHWFVLAFHHQPQMWGGSSVQHARSVITETWPVIRGREVVVLTGSWEARGEGHRECRRGRVVRQCLRTRHSPLCSCWLSARFRRQRSSQGSEGINALGCAVEWWRLAAITNCTSFVWLLSHFTDSIW